MMFMKKNGAVISVIALLLFVAMYLNWQYGRVEVSELVNAERNEENLTIETADDSTRFTEMQYDISLDNISASGDSSVSDGSIVTGARAGELSAYFDETRLGRQQTRDEAIDLLQSTLSSEAANDDVKTAAEESISVLATNAVAESRIESLVMAKGFIECVAIIDETGVNVVVLPEEEGLQASDVSKIKDIILSQTAVTADQIRIIEAK